jgi:hypothetical protein
MARTRGRMLTFAALALAALALPGAGTAGEDFKPEPGFVSLFNGKDLTGWRMGKAALDGKAETANKRFTVSDGAIVIDGKGGGDLYTVKDFNKDFHLKAEFRAAPKADSGLYIRGTQLQVRDYPTVGPYKNVKGFKNGDWNELDIVVRGGHVTRKVNGKSLGAKDTLDVSFKDGKPQASVNGKPVEVSKIEIGVGAVAVCKCNGEVIEPAFVVPEKGGIGLQSESGKFEFRRIRVKELD